MAVFTYSVSLFIIGAIIAAVFHGMAGAFLIGVAVVGMFVSLLRFVEADASMEQDDVEDRLGHHPR
jgi:hypothetical protein